MTTYENISWLPSGSKIEISHQESKTIPVTAVFCFIFSPDNNSIYLMENANRDRGLDIPGGHIDPGETSLEALHREVLEEVGLSIKNVSFIGNQNIIKTIVEDKYPDLISSQSFYMATIDKVVTDKLEDDSLERVKVNVREFERNLLNNEKCYYKELYVRALNYRI